MKGPVQHVARPAPPWRRPDPAMDLTECGRLLAEVAPEYLTTRDALTRYIREVGQQRAAFTTCMTCAMTIDRHSDWDADPASVLGRDGHAWRRQFTPQQSRTRTELLAVALLVEAHRDEFEETVTAQAAAEKAGEQLVAARAEKAFRARVATRMRPL